MLKSEVGSDWWRALTTNATCPCKMRTIVAKNRIRNGFGFPFDGQRSTFPSTMTHAIEGCCQAPIIQTSHIFFAG